MEDSTMSLHHFFLFFFLFSLFPSLLQRVIPRVFCMLIFFLPSFPLVILNSFIYSSGYIIMTDSFAPLYIQRERPPEANELNA
jgi:hypothetical protein